MLLGDILMNPNAALSAVKQGEPSIAALVVIDRGDKSILQYALSVASNVKFLLSLERADQCIVVSATAKLNWAIGKGGTKQC